MGLESQRLEQRAVDEVLQKRTVQMTPVELRVLPFKLRTVGRGWSRTSWTASSVAEHPPAGAGGGGGGSGHAQCARPQEGREAAEWGRESCGKHVDPNHKSRCKWFLLSHLVLLPDWFARLFPD